MSAMTSISFFKGFSLFRTMNIEETAEWLLQFAFKLDKEGSAALPFYANANANANAMPNAMPNADSIAMPADPGGYAEVVSKRIKKDNITPENIGEIMLSQIPNVSSASAAAIMKQFRTLAALLTALQNDSTCLNTITTINKNGQHKKLTKPCVNSIYDFLVKRTIINVDI
jgi:ERCC4-type nuclease